MKKFTQRESKKVLEVRRGASRRLFLQAGTMLAASAAAGPLILVPGKAKAAERLVIPSWGGRFGDAQREVYWDPFTAETGIEIVNAGSPDMGKALAQIQSGNLEWDLFEPESNLIKAAEEQGLLEPLDFSIIDTGDLAYPSAKRDFAMAYMTFANGIGWSSERHPKPESHPKDFVEFWDPDKFPGRRGMYAFSPAFVLETAILGEGVPADQVYPIDVDRAFASLERMKPHIEHWIKATGDTVKLLQVDEADFTTTFNGRVFGARESGVPLDFSLDQVINSFSWMGVLKGSKNKDAAMRLINFMMDPGRQAAFCEIFTYAPVTNKGLAMISDGIKKWVPSANNPRNLVVDYDWWGAPGRLDELTKRFNEFKLS